MWEIEYTTRFKKDLKRFKRQSAKISELKKVLIQLRGKGTVEAKYKPHSLSGAYLGCIECHVQSDFLLIWIDAANHVIKLVRLGTHSELFK